MAYDFADLSGDSIYPGAVANANTFSFFARFRLKSDTGPTGNRWLASINDAAAGLYQLAILFRNGFTNRLEFEFTKSGGAASAACLWTTGWTTPLTVSVTFTYDQSDLKIYEGTDATPKATAAETGTPDQGSQQMGLGRVFYTFTAEHTAPIILYEAAWWPGTVLTGAQAAALGAGNARGLPLPANYWPLKANPNDLFGTALGVVTGATLVTHAGANLYTAIAAKSLGAARLVNGGLVG